MSIDPNTDPTSIGNLLTSLGVCTREQVTEAVAQMKLHPEKRLGEILVQLGVVQANMVDLMLANQRAQRAHSSKNVQRYVQMATEYVTGTPTLKSLTPLTEKVLTALKRRL